MANSTMGERIQRLLASKGMNQRNLSQATSLTESAVSRYVTGEREPRGAILLCIANALSTSVEYLKGDTEDARAKGMNEELNTAYSILERNAESMSAEDKMRFAEVLFQSGIRTFKETSFVSGVKLDAVDYNDIEKALMDMLKDLDIHQFPLDCFAVARLLGIDCISYFELTDEVSNVAHNISEDGFSMIGHNGRYVIYYNDQRPCERISFTIWHEIGHIQMGHIEDEISGEGCYLRMEAEANHFAHAAIAPTAFVIALHPQDSYQIASAFNISLQCAKYAFYTYNRIMQCSPQFIDYISNARIAKLLTFNPPITMTMHEEESHGW